MIVPRLADWCGIEIVDEQGDPQQVAVAHADPAKVEMAYELRKRYPPIPTPRPASRRILRGGPAELYREIPDEMIVAAAVDDEHLRIIRELGMRSAMAVPMRIGDGDARRHHVRVGRERARVRRRRSRVRRRPRAAGCDRDPERAPVRRTGADRSHAAGEPAPGAPPARSPGGRPTPHYQAGERGADVGGDFYDVLPVDAGYLVVLGDVTGKGIEAAALTSLVRHSARMAARFDARPARVLALVNQVLREQPRLSLVTVVCALVETDGDQARVTVASAGHPLPLLRRAGEAPAPLGDHGVLLGVAGEEDWSETPVRLTAGDTVLFYTDGVTETPGEGTRYGEARLREVMSRAGDDPAALLAEIEQSLRAFQAGATLDDRAMLALRFLGRRDGPGATIPTAATSASP